ncbi:uncharacterized protein LOC103575345 [Microplitis demolitor]|uniref:uncharacterized protein LOC103575345 n=1 Tax=Microplitis demolitor TaxID=69319 RepID=UPI0006D4D1F9|nr:uncharacterized protein LOC103575345 [Microplitis demolitor]
MESNKIEDNYPVYKKKSPKKWYNFQVISPSMAILRGNYSIFDKHFKFASRGLQATACCVVAIVFSRLFKPKDWTEDLVNQVLEHGDKLFRLSQSRNRIKSGTYMTTKLVYPEFFINDYKVCIYCEPNKVCGNLFTESVGCPVLVEGVNKFLKDHEAGILTTQGISVAIWRHTLAQDGGLKCWYFNPASCKDLVRRATSPNDSACLMLFKDINDLVELFLMNINQPYDSSYCIDKVIIVRINLINRSLPDNKSKLTANKNVYTRNDRADGKNNTMTTRNLKLKKNQPVVNTEPLSITISNYNIDMDFARDPLIDQNNFDTGYDYYDMEVNIPSTFHELSQGRAILHGWTHEMSEVYKGKGAQNVANCIAALAIKKIHPVRTWLRPKLDEILSLGDALYLEVKNTNSVKRAIDFNDRKIQVDGRNLFVDVDLMTVTGTLASKVPEVLNLKQALVEFFLINTEGVIECSSMATAIWSQDGCYYLFDPRQCDANGGRVREEPKSRKQKKDLEVKKKVNGKCCVIRFPTIDLLADNYLRNVETNKNDRFIVRNVSLADDVPGTRKWREFEPGEAGRTWVLQGTISNEDEDFENAGMQGIAIPVVALINAHKMAPQDWTKMAVDQIIRDGDGYFKWCIPDDDVDEQLTLRNLKRNVYINNQRVKIRVDEASVVGNSADGFPALAEGIKNFFTDHQYGIVEFQDQVVGIWKYDDQVPKVKGKDAAKETTYYCFDPNPRGPRGEKNSEDEEAACVIRAVDPEELARVIESNAGEAESDEFFIHVFEVVDISDPMTAEEIEEDKSKPVKPELGAFAEINEDSACLYGNVDKDDKSQAAVALVTLAMTKLYSPFLWTREVVDDIVKLGSKIAESNVENLPEEEEARTYLLPREVDDFDIGVNRISVEVEENATGTSDNLATMLQEFLTKNPAGILRQDNIMLPIWKEGDIFFTFNPSSNPEAKENATVFWFTNLAALVSNLQQTFDNTASIVLDSVSLESEYETRVAENERPKPTTSDETLWHNFPKISEGVWQLLGNTSVSDEKFPPENHGNQTAALAIMAVIFSKVYEARWWTKEIVDEVVVTADKLHSKSVERLGNVLNPRVNQIIPEFFLSNRRLDLTVRDCVESGKVDSKLTSMNTLKKGLDSFFQEFISGALTIGDVHIGIWKSKEYFILLPDVPKFKADSTVDKIRAMRFATTDHLANYLSNFVDEEEDYEIHAIDVIDWNKLPPWKYDPSPAVRPSNLPALNAYRQLLPARAILRAGIHQSSDIFPPSIRNRQTASNCVVALAMSVVKNSLTWTKKTLDEILAIGSKLHRESSKAKSVKDKIKPTDVIRVFHVGVNALTADVEVTVSGLVGIAPPEPEEKGKKPKKPKPTGKGKKKVREPPPAAAPPLIQEGIESFFEGNNAGILKVNNYMVSLWKDHGVYFLYDPRARNDQGLKCSDGVACVMWFACLEPLYDTILSNIDEDDKFGSYEIYRVIINTFIVESLPSPVGFQAFADCPQAETALGTKQMKTVDVKTVTEFVQVDKDLSVLKGNRHMNSPGFDLTSRGYQSTAIAAVAIVVAVLHVPSTWTSDLIDAIIKYGDVLHRDSARIKRAGLINLSPTELLSTFIVGDFRVSLSIDGNMAAGILLVHDLAQALGVFFKNNCAGILHTINFAVAVMQHYGKFYMFDPSECDKFGRSYYLDDVDVDGDDDDDNREGRSASGGACVAKCENIMRLAKIFVDNCNYKVPCVYTINAVNVRSIQFFSK